MHPEGKSLAFIDTNNVLYWRTTLQRVDIPTDITYGITNDTSVGLLSEDLPASVGFLPVLPTNFTNYLPQSATKYVQAIGMNQDMKLFGRPTTFYGDVFLFWDSGTSSPLGLDKRWNVAMRPGDSSAPDTLLIGNQLVLMSHNFETIDGPNYGLKIIFDAINQSMHYLSTNNIPEPRSDYQLTPFPLTNWPSIP